MANRLCELKSGQFQLMRLAIYQANWGEVQAFVADQVASAPEFFAQAAVAIDVSAIAPALSLASLEDLQMRLRYAGVLPIAVVADVDDPITEHAHALKLGVVAPLKKSNGKLEIETAATVASMPATMAVATTDVLASKTAPAQVEPEKAQQANKVASKVASNPASNPGSKPEPGPEHKTAAKAQAAPAPSADSTKPNEVVKAPTPAVPQALPPQLYDGPVRSGQQLYARARDLIVTGPIGAGAEVMADGHVHIYGRLQGKVIAGASGDRSARIFAQVFGAELIAIAGVYRVMESLSSDIRGRAVQIFLDGDKLKIEPL